LLHEKKDAAEVAEVIRADRSLGEPQRHAALRVVLRRAPPTTEGLGQEHGPPCRPTHPPPCARRSAPPSPTPPRVSPFRQSAADTSTELTLVDALSYRGVVVQGLLYALSFSGFCFESKGFRARLRVREDKFCRKRALRSIEEDRPAQAPDWASPTSWNC